MTNTTSLFRNRSLLVLGAAEAVANTGSWIAMMAVLSMLVFNGSGGVLQSSGVFLAGLVPVLICSPLAGLLSDRLDRRGLMVASQVLSGAAMTGLLFTTRLECIYAVLAVQAVFSALMIPARQAAVPALVPQESLPRANAFLQQLTGIVKITAPAAAGFLLAVLPARAAILIIIFAYLVSAFILTHLPPLPPAPILKTRDGQTVAGKVLPRNSQALRLLFAINFLSITLLIGFDVLAPVYTRDILQGGEELFGLLVALIGAGTLLATTMLILRKQERDSWWDFSAGILLLATIPAALAASGFLTNSALALLFVLGGCLVGGMGNGLVVVQSATLIQRLSPPGLLGRMGGLYQGVATAGQLGGMMLTPLLVPVLITLNGYFLGGAVLMLILGIYTVVVANRMAVKLTPAASGGKISLNEGAANE